NAPIGACGEVAEGPTGAAWIGKNLLVWSPSQVVLVSGENVSKVWKLPLVMLPAVEMVGGDEVAAAPSRSTGVADSDFVDVRPAQRQREILRRRMLQLQLQG